MTKPVSKAQLHRLSAAGLIEQYDLATADPGAKRRNAHGKTALQRRIDYIVDLLFVRADAGDADAEAWFAST